MYICMCMHACVQHRIIIILSHNTMLCKFVNNHYVHFHYYHIIIMVIIMVIIIIIVIIVIISSNFHHSTQHLCVSDPRLCAKSRWQCLS